MKARRAALLVRRMRLLEMGDDSACAGVEWSGHALMRDVVAVSGSPLRLATGWPHLRLLPLSPHRPPS